MQKWQTGNFSNTFSCVHNWTTKTQLEIMFATTALSWKVGENSRKKVANKKLWQRLLRATAANQTHCHLNINSIRLSVFCERPKKSQLIVSWNSQGLRLFSTDRYSISALLARFSRYWLSPRATSFQTLSWGELFGRNANILKMSDESGKRQKHCQRHNGPRV